VYDVTSILPDEVDAGLQPGTNLLIAGPPMIGKHRLALALLANGLDDGDGLLCISTNDSATALVDALSQHAPSFEREQLGIVSCVGKESSRAPDGVVTEYVSSPSDLTGISIGTVKILDSLSKRDITSIRHGVLSVSTLQQYLGTQAVFKFLHIYTSRVSDTDGLGVFTLNSSKQDSERMNILASEFDGVLELRETDDGGREVRLTGIPAASRTWCPY